MSKFIKILIPVFITIFAYSGYKVYEYCNETKESIETYSLLEEYTYFDTDSTENKGIVVPQVDFNALYHVNDDIVSWIYCEDTVINYPVVQGNDNSYYLSHLFDGSYNNSGCLYLDSRNSRDFSDDNSIIYGHNMKNGTMLASINQYKEQSYYDKYPYMLLITPDNNFKVNLFAGFMEDIKGDAWQIEFKGENEKIKWLEEAKNKSTFVSDVFPSSEDKIVTFSTCSDENSNVRYVLMGVLECIKQ